MNAIRIIVAVALAGVLAVLWGQHRQLGLQRDLIAAQAEIAGQLRDGIETLQDASDRNRDQMTALLQAQQRVQTNLAARVAEIRRLQTDVQEIRVWADQPLPAGIQRLLQHPAATGAGDYGAPVPAGDPLHDDRRGTEVQR